jgi:hypothetical protein
LGFFSFSVFLFIYILAIIGICQPKAESSTVRVGAAEADQGKGCIDPQVSKAGIPTPCQ